MEEKRYYTIPEIQKILGISRPTAYELVRQNYFKSHLIGGKHIISRKSFDAWFDGDDEKAHVVLLNERETYVPKPAPVIWPPKESGRT